MGHLIKLGNGLVDLGHVVTAVFGSNRGMTHATTPDTIDHRLTELEIKASFSEDLLDQLNLIIVRQQQQIDQLVRELGHLRQLSADNSAGGARHSLEDLPPHY